MVAALLTPCATTRERQHRGVMGSAVKLGVVQKKERQGWEQEARSKERKQIAGNWVYIYAGCNALKWVL